MKEIVLCFALLTTPLVSISMQPSAEEQEFVRRFFREHSRTEIVRGQLGAPRYSASLDSYEESHPGSFISPDEPPLYETLSTRDQEHESKVRALEERCAKQEHNLERLLKERRTVAETILAKEALQKKYEYLQTLCQIADQINVFNGMAHNKRVLALQKGSVTVQTPSPGKKHYFIRGYAHCSSVWVSQITHVSLSGLSQYIITDGSVGISWQDVETDDPVLKLTVPAD